MNARFASQRRYTGSTGMKDTFGDFTCLHCGNLVSASSLLSGVRNRNHCPYCLTSRHLDLYQAGDRLSACKERMAPVGLALKRGAAKYALAIQGELLLVHACQGCSKLSINRIAADDDSARLLQVFERSAQLDGGLPALLRAQEISLLGAQQAALVRVRLFGKN